LTSLRGFSQILLELAEDDRLDAARSRRALRGIDLQTDRFARLIDHLFELPSIESGELVLEPSLTDIACICEEVVEAARHHTLSHTFVLEAPGEVWADVDGARIRQVLTDLTDNAIRFSPRGGTITVSASTPDSETVRLAVRDTGLGVPVEQRAHLFERLGQGHAESYRSGLGLGLYISRHIVELHGGQIEAWFPDEGGSLFIVTLPRGAERPESAGASSRA
jgi:signal transduction histidine kinase